MNEDPKLGPFAARLLAVAARIHREAHKERANADSLSRAACKLEALAPYMSEEAAEESLESLMRDAPELLIPDTSN